MYHLYFKDIMAILDEHTSQIVDAVYTHDGCYLGILKETNNRTI